MEKDQESKKVCWVEQKQFDGLTKEFAELQRINNSLLSRMNLIEDLMERSKIIRIRFFITIAIIIAACAFGFLSIVGLKAIMNPEARALVLPNFGGN